MVCRYSALLLKLPSRQRYTRKFEPVRISELSKKERWAIIRSSIFLKEKFKPNGTFDKLKACLVADISMQDRNIYEVQ